MTTQQISIGKDLFDKLVADNKRLVRELAVERQLTDVLDNYRQLALDWRYQCVCPKSDALVETADSLDSMYRQAIDKKSQIEMTSKTGPKKQKPGRPWRTGRSSKMIVLSTGDGDDNGGQPYAVSRTVDNNNDDDDDDDYTISVGDQLDTERQQPLVNDPLVDCDDGGVGGGQLSIISRNLSDTGLPSRQNIAAGNHSIGNGSGGQSDFVFITDLLLRQQKSRETNNALKTVITKTPQPPPPAISLPLKRPSIKRSVTAIIGDKSISGQPLQSSLPSSSSSASISSSISSLNNIRSHKPMTMMTTKSRHVRLRSTVHNVMATTIITAAAAATATTTKATDISDN
ncbi:uncharacterized protein LOC128959922 [Oppia nitens]|uniref:uncharacterized protein LOC128959922 n=1 Tax=Oppia nitens TaxID=1686743 RepID=UPI0023D9799B|nr:uncharacterized protein LOC128959922 [Oppia nitens]